MKQNLSILVLDEHDSSTLGSVQEALQPYPSSIRSCSSAKALVSAIRHHAVDVVVIGLAKPFDASLQILNKIKEMAPQVEVIFVSHFDEESLWLWIDVIQRGAFEFLPKPLDALELQRVLIQATEKHHPVRELRMPPAESISSPATKVHKSRASSTNC